MKKPVAALATVLAAAILAACGATSGTDTAASPDTSKPLRIGATPVPHAEILESIKDEAAAQGLTLDIVEYTDYVQPNVALSEGQLDANYFQHVPYLQSQIEERGYELAPAFGVHLEPLGIYSQKVESVGEIPDGGTVTIPNDPTNAGRALDLLAAQGLIELKEVEGTVTVQDIAANPKNLNIKEIEAATLPRTLQDVDAAVINGNYALEAELDPSKDALALEDAEGNPYVNVVAVKTGSETDPRIVTLQSLLRSDAVRTFIEENYSGTVIPAF